MPVSDTRSCQAAVDSLRAERKAFAEQAEFLSKSFTNLDTLHHLGAIPLVAELLQDSDAGVQANAATTLSRFSSHNAQTAKAVATDATISRLTELLSSPDAKACSAACVALRTAAKQSAPLAARVCKCALPTLQSQLQTGDAAQQESAAWTIGYIASHSEALAARVVLEGAVEPLVACLANKRKSAQLQSRAAAALLDIAKHGSAQAARVVDAGGVDKLGQMACSEDAKASKQGLAVLAVLARSSPDAARAVCTSCALDALPACLQSEDDAVRKDAASLIQQAVHLDPEVQSRLERQKAVLRLVTFAKEMRGPDRLPAIQSLNQMASSGAVTATDIISQHGMSALVAALTADPEAPTRTAAATGLGIVGAYSAEHCKAAVEAGAMPALISPAGNPEADPELSLQCRNTLKLLIPLMTDAAELDALLRWPLPESVLQMVLGQLLAGLGKGETEAKLAAFETSGGLQLIQQLGEQGHRRLGKLVAAINFLFPEQVVLKYNPLYRPDANASASLQPEQAGSVGVGRPTKRVSLKYNLRVVESTPDAVQSKAAAVSALDTMPEDSSDSIAAIRSSSQIAQEA